MVNFSPVIRLNSTSTIRLTTQVLPVLHCAKPKANVDATQVLLTLCATLNNPTTLVNDVALIFLPWEITCVPRVELNRDANFPAVGQNLEVFGWGLTSFEPTIEFPNIIQTLTVQALTNEACGEQWGKEILPDVLCATIEGKGIGQGDSGTCISWAEVF